MVSCVPLRAHFRVAIACPEHHERTTALKPYLSVGFAVILSLVLIGRHQTKAASTAPAAVAVGFGNNMPTSCATGYPTLFVQQGTTGLVTVNACSGGKYVTILRAPRFANQDTPKGTLDGVNSTFSLSHVPNPTTTVQLFRNGILQAQGVDYTLSAGVVTFSANAIPKPGDLLFAWYQ